MTLPVGVLAGGLVLLAVAILALHRPILARLGVSRATQRPRQLILVAAGLMVATAVATSALVAAESIGDSQGEAAMARIGATDVVVRTQPRDALDASQRDALLRDDAVAANLSALAPALRVPASIEDERTGLGEARVALWGIDPQASARLDQLDTVQGSLSTDTEGWPDDVVAVNQALADRLQAETGDPIRLFVEGPAEPERSWTNRSGTLVLAHREPDGSYTHAPADTYAFEVDIPTDALLAHVLVWPTGSTPTDLDLELVSPDGDRRLIDEGTAADPVQPNATLADDGLEPGTWQLEVHAKRAAGTDFQLAVLTIREPDAPTTTVEIEGHLAGIVADAGSDPVGAGPAAYVDRGRLADAMGIPEGANVLLAQATAPDQAPQLAEAFEAALDARGHDDAGVRDVRSDALETAREGAPFVKTFFLTLGSFSILAGFLLIVVLVAMLVEERREELGTLRAIGAHRSHLTQAHLHEGAVYALAAGLLGLGVGLGLARFIVEAAEGFSFYGGVPLSLTLNPWTLAGALGAGFALTVAATAIAAYRTSGLEIAPALKGERERSTEIGWWGWTWRTALLLAGALLTAAWVVTGTPPLAVAGPPLIVLGLAGLLGQVVPRERLYPIVGLALVGYIGASFVFLTDLDGDLDLLLMPIRGLMLTVGAALVLAWARTPARIAGRLARWLPGLDAVGDTAAEYTRQRPSQTTMTLSMVGLVVLVLVMTSTVTAMMAPNLAQQVHGVDVVGSTRTPLDPGAEAPVDGVERWIQTPLAEALLYRGQVGEGSLFTRGGDRTSMDAIGATEALARAGLFEPTDLAPGVDSLGEAIERAARGAPVAVVADGVRVSVPEGQARTIEPGDRLTLPAETGSVNLTVAAIVRGGAFAGAIVPADTLAGASSDPATRVFVDAAPGVDAAELARGIERAYRAQGMDAETVEAAGQAARSDARTQTLILEVFLGTGLLVGIAAIGLVTARNVHERRREVGVLRAVGAGRGQVVGLFVVETLLLVTMGVAVGFGGGLLSAYGAYLTTFEATGAVFAPDWANLGLLVAAAYATALVAAWWPARRAAGLAPAQAVRAVD